MIHMTKEAIIEKAIKAIHQLPHEKAEEISDFVDFLTMRHEEQLLQKGIEIVSDAGQSFAFLMEEEELYTLPDLNERSRF